MTDVGGLLPRAGGAVTLSEGPAGLFTVDVEPDDVWRDPRSAGLRNIEMLPGLQRLCDSYGVRPTYLIAGSVLESPAASGVLERLLSDGACEIGAHPHLWELSPFTAVDKSVPAPVASMYSPDVVAEKVARFTERLRSRFGRVVSHRAGRWGLTETYVDVLESLGLLADTSVTPGIDWSAVGAPDYTRAPVGPYRLSRVGLAVPGSSSVLEVPCTIRPGARLGGLERTRVGAAVRKRAGAGPAWLRCSPATPRGRLLAVSAWAFAQQTCINLMTHSSELLPGASPYWETAEAIERHMGDLAAVFDWWRSHGVQPMTLGEFASARAVQQDGGVEA